jgi:NAD+--asparagine ADP-ribosyltransferase
MVAAEKRQSRLGLVAVAKAFAALEEDKVASMVLSRIGKNWVEQTNDLADIVSPGCWDTPRFIVR